MPVLEARASGTRIAASDINVLREAGENEAAYVAPTVDGIRDGILKTLNSAARCSGRQRLWTWQESCGVFIRVLTEANQSLR
jgi:hypothetical protein